MWLAVRYLFASLSDYYYDLFRMALVNLFWFLTALPALLVILVGYVNSTLGEIAPGNWLLLLAAFLLTLVLAGPGTAAVYDVMGEVVDGELLFPSRFWPAFRRRFWRGWGLATINVLALLLLALNIVFYLHIPVLWMRLLVIVFGYLFILALGVQAYLFPLLVALNQPYLRLIRNAIFLVLDNLGLSLGLLLIRLLLAAMSLPITLGLLVLPFLSMVLLAMVDSRAFAGLAQKYRALEEAGRLGPGRLS